MRIFALAGLPRIQFQLLDSLAGCGPGAGIFIAFAANTILSSIDIVGSSPDPAERVTTIDHTNGLGIDLPTDGVP